MKKTISILLSAALMAGSICACDKPGEKPGEDDGKLSIVTTIFPEYDWVVNTLGDNPAGAEVTMLLDNGVDLHSYQPTANDILTISNCDLFIYVGGESDGWVEDALREAVNQDMVVLNLLDILGDTVVEEEVVEGMQEEEHDHEHGHDEDEEHDEDHDEDHEHEDEDHDDHDEDEHHDEDHDEAHEEGHDHEHEHGEGEIEYDEHVWLSLRNAAVLVQNISDALCSIDPDNASTYRANSESYISSLNDLDERYSAAVTEGSTDTLLFGDRFPFRYLTEDYGLNYYAAFVGCSAETEASFETITFLSSKVDELGLNTVLTIEGPDHRIAETIVDNTSSRDQQILTLDSMQSVTAADVSNGVTYLSIMESNLEVLSQALS